MNHNMNDPRHPWVRLTTAARQLKDDRDTSAPYGFATRLAALALSQERRVVSLFERVALRAVGVAALLAMFSVVLNYQELSTSSTTVVAQSDEAAAVDLISADDAVAVVLDFAD